MNAAIISVGDELLLGQTINTNASWMGEELAKIGLDLRLVLTIADGKEDIENALEICTGKFDFIFITGGLGPTKDDITKNTIAQYFKQSLVVNEAVLANVKQLFASFNRPVLPVNELQALVPERARVIVNKVGTAPAMWLSEKGSQIISMPGVPYEMKYLMSHEIIPAIVKENDLPHIVSVFILTQGIGESFIASEIEDIEDALPSEVKLAYLPSRGMVKLRLTARGRDRKKLELCLRQEKNKIIERIKEHVCGEDQDNLIEVAAEFLKSNHYTLSTAESCTGGAIAAEFTSVPGSSAYFIGSVISYATQVKISELSVNPTLIDEKGVVSAEVAEAMALGVKSKFNTDFAIASTGYAGPEGGDEKNPVGTVYLAIAGPENQVFSKVFQFGKVRANVVRRAVVASIGMLLKNNR